MLPNVVSLAFLTFITVNAQTAGSLKKVRDRSGRCIEPKLHCDRSCKIGYREGCPWNCNCGELPRCPRIQCPLPQPQCLVLTQRDGCQTCGCKNPVVIMEDDDGRRVNVFVRVRFLSWQNGHKLLAEKRAEAARSRRRNDFANAAVLDTFATRITKIPLDGDVDPSVFERALIDAFRNNGSLIQRHNHFLLLETEEIEPVLTEEPAEPTVYVPQPPRFRGEIPTTTTTQAPPVLTAENCTDDMKNYLDAKMKPMYWELNRRRDPIKDAAFPYPLVFKYSRSEVLTACSNFWQIQRVTNKNILNTCKGFYGRLDEVLRNYEYPCGYQTQQLFFRNYNCLYNTRLESSAIQHCEDRARYFLEDPFLDRCDIYTILADCIYDVVVEECGQEAWNNLYEYVQHVAKYYDQHCIVLKPVRESTAAPFQRNRS